MELNGVKFRVKRPINTGHRRRDTYHTTTFEFDLDKSLHFKLKNRTLWDTFFNQLRLSTRIYTNDVVFDEKVWLSSDSPFFNTHLKNDSHLRRMILELIDKECYKIKNEEKILSFTFDGNQKWNNSIKKTCVNIFENLKTIQSINHEKYDDKKINFVTSFIWGLSVFALTYFLVPGSSEYYFNDNLLKLQGTLIGLTSAIIIFALIFKFKQKSTHIHFISFGYLITACISFSILGSELLAKLNTVYDNKPKIIFESKVIDRFQNGEKYFISLESVKGIEKHNIPSMLLIDSNLFNKVKKGSPIKVSFSQGYLNHPYIDYITLANSEK